MTEMLNLINELWYLKRDLVSEDFDRSLFRLADEVSMTIHEYPTGENCWTWRIPEKWSCQEAYLETLEGERLIDYADHPLHVVSYSLPYVGLVSRDELLRHLHVHPNLPDAIPFVFKYYDRDWGLCTTRRLRDSLQNNAYQVVIRTRFEPGTLKVGEIVVPGETDESFVLAAHLDHGAMANDDLTGVVVGVEVARALLAGPPRHYTYRILFLPETIGSVAYLSHNEALIPQMVGGLFLEMLGNDSPHALQGSFQPESQPDRCLRSALHKLDPQSYLGEFRGIIDNDERQFNAPGVRVPMLSLSRVEAPKTSGRPPYPQYHSSLDTPDIITQERLEVSRDLVLSLIDAWEKNQVPFNDFKGEVFCSGYGIWIDHRTNPAGHRRLFDIMDRCDGTRSIADIAAELEIPFQSAWEVVNQLADKKLVRLSYEGLLHYQT